MHNQTLASDRSSLLHQIDHFCILGSPNSYHWNLLATAFLIQLSISLQLPTVGIVVLLQDCDLVKLVTASPFVQQQRGRNQQFCQRLCVSKFDYEWNLKTQCKRGEYGYSKSVFRREVGFCPGDCIASIGNEGMQQTILMAFCMMYNLVLPPPPLTPYPLPHTTLTFKERDPLVS